MTTVSAAVRFSPTPPAFQADREYRNVTALERCDRTLAVARVAGQQLIVDVSRLEALLDQFEHRKQQDGEPGARRRACAASMYRDQCRRMDWRCGLGISGRAAASHGWY
ncbi:hypothetical protein [Bradyrhizobium aeschynomenes]|uniref:hypothetical protein n=1 Tax=Bradyrhizobium aeschynomenes TaxID=2734909 RepID=UPI00289C327A|nr:hypothetical protein [Bradyrhizobium aeschynomenes]